MHRKRGGRPVSDRAPTATTAGAPWARRFIILSVGWSLAVAPVVAWPDTYYVDNRNPSCSSSGPGTQSQPYCTISDAVFDYAGPGVTIVVMPGTYRESVDAASGTSAAPFVIQGEGRDVIMDGADSFADPSLWAPYAGSVFLEDSVTSAPEQVFVDGARLRDTTGTSPGLIPPGSFAWVLGQGLYVNIGGDNPGAHQTLVGRRSYAFGLWGTSYVTIRGFHVTRFDDRGIEMGGGANNCAILNNRVDFCFSDGVRASRCSGILIAGNTILDNFDSGIVLAYGTTSCTIQDNECGRNAVPNAFHDGSGVYLFGAPGNLIQRNRLYQNNDEGLNFQSGSNNNLSIQNIAWGNADHGFDELGATGNVHIGDVAWRNAFDGFAVDGNATGTVLYDCIATDNGLSTGKDDLWVDASSMIGFVSDYNIFWNSTPQAPVRYNNVRYTSVAAYSAVSGQDVHTLQADPRFANPTAGSFDLLQGSPAIDSGISSVPNWPPTDAEGNPRVDDPSTLNTGAGNPPYADRGALEFRDPPVLAVGGDNPPGMLPLVPRLAPAPVRASADLMFFTTRPGPLEVALYDLAGRRVRELMNDPNAPPGLYHLAVTTGGHGAGALPPGICFVRVHAAEGTAIGRFAVVR